MVKIVGGEVAEELRDISFRIYKRAAFWARIHGIIIADTKLEFGLHGGQIKLVDELLTPDSSRFWDFVEYRSGSTPPSFDKQPVRDWLVASGWNKQPPAPLLSDAVIEGTRKRYIESYECLVEKRWPPDFV